MNKKQFIQQSVIHDAPKSPKELQTCISQATNRWEALTALGHGDAKQTGPRDMKNHYNDLSVFQKEWFDKFWNAFKHKEALQRAALAWGKLGELSEVEYMVIVEAAKAEAAKPRRSDESRKMAEGWLTERRFDDYSKVAKPNVESKSRREQIQEYHGEIESLKLLNKATPSEAYEKRISELEVLMDELRQQ